MANTTIPSELIQASVALGGSPTTTTQSASDNTTKIATTAYVTAAVNSLIDSAPGTMNTLNEIAAALNDDAAFNTTVTNAIATKLPLGGGTMTGNLIVNASLDISGDIDVDGTTNLDVVDIDGAVDMASTLTVSGLTNLKSPVQVRNATQNFNGGLSAEVNSGIINFGINEGSGNRFGGSYTQANQGGMLNFDTRAGNPLFQIYGRTAGTATATGSILFQIDSTGNTVVNEAGADADFRVESNDNANMLFVDGGNNRVGIGAPPSAPFTVSAADGTLAVFTNTTSADLAIKTASGVLLITPSTGTLAFGTSNTERMRINSSGNVGINWTGSTARLGIIQSGSSTPGMNITDGTSSDFMVYAGHSSGIARIGPSTGQLAIQTGGTERMRIDSAGDVGIGITTPNGHKLHIYDGANAAENSAPLRIQGSGYSGYHWLNGTAYYIGQNSNGRQLRMYSGSNEGVGVYLTNGGNSWSSYSDERLKENIADIGSVTEKIKDIRCVTYNRKDVDDENKHETIGFIAHDFVGKFDQVLDESKVSDTDEETRYSIRYTETIPILMKAIQEQQTLIESLTARIETLEG